LGVVGRAQEPLLAQGYAVATATLNIFENNGNHKVSAETLAMVKEHWIKAYGKPVHTIGWGGSGGALQQYLIAQDYPGLLDGIIPGLSFPDWITTAQTITDCALLNKAFTATGLTWSEEQKTAVSGLATWRTCAGWARDWQLPNPQAYCDQSMPKDLIYDPIERPNGVRCDFYTVTKNVLGHDPRTGDALRPLDNVGVQYGLTAFNNGQIDAEHFLALNERIGGYDNDGHIVATRTTADAPALRAAYQGGLLLTGGGALGQTPIIDWRQYSDDMADVHDRLRSFVTRARLVAANGSAANQTILIDPRPDPAPPDGRYLEREGELVALMDRWLGNLDDDDGPGTLAEKVAHDRPDDLKEGCWATDGERINENQNYNKPGRCNALYPPHGDPRIAAGGPLVDDVLKCQLKPVSLGDYANQWTAIQQNRLRHLFPSGVCDYTRPASKRPYEP
jgi:hypothetical protein